MASLAFVQNALAQAQYFVYLQTENNRPFYVQLNKKSISSSSVGHLILPQLAAGTYDIVVGFAGENTRQEYQLMVKDRDQGFLIKGLDGGSRYGLLNLQTAEVQLSGSAKEAALAEQKKQQEALAAEKQRQEEARLAEQKRQQDEAAKLAEQQKQADEAQKQIEAQALAEAKRKREEAAQTAMTEKNTATPPPAAPPPATDADPKAAELKRKQEEEIKRYNAERLAALKKQEQEAEAKKLAEKAAENNTGEKTLSAAEILRLQEEARRIDARGKRDSALKATAPATNDKGSQPKFLDMDFTMPDSSNKSIPMIPLVPADTVRMPLADTIIVTKYSPDSAKVEVPVGSKKDSAKAQPLEVTQTAFTPQEAKPEAATAKVADSTVAKAAEAVATARVDTLPNQSAAVKAAVDSALATPLASSNCMAEATNGDIDLMLMLIRAERDPENALDLVKKMVRLKCVSTVQVRKLAGQFGTDEARYQLLDMCYKYTIDRKQYGVLANLLTEVYFINRFKALVQ